MLARADSYIHQDLEMAADFQRAVLPEYPAVPYLSCSILFHPCGHVSGDVYNFQLNREGEIAIYLGDATGHGITAALMTMLVHLSLENFPGNLGTDDILRRLNRMIARHKTGLSIASQLFRVSPDGTLCVTHAGQPSLIVQPRSHDGYVVFNQGGCPIGMFTDEKVPYVEETWKLNSGDRLIAYTDGLVDWKNRKGESFGEERLLEALASDNSSDLEQFLLRLYEDVLAFAQGQKNQDDVTLMCFEYRPVL